MVLRFPFKKKNHYKKDKEKSKRFYKKRFKKPIKNVSTKVPVCWKCGKIGHKAKGKYSIP